MDVHKGQGTEMLKGLKDEQLSQSACDCELGQGYQSVRVGL